MLASPRFRDHPRSDSSSDVIAPQSIISRGAVPTVIIVVTTAPTTVPPPYYKLIVVSSLSPLMNVRAFLPLPSLLLLACHPRRHRHRSLCRPTPSRRRRYRRRRLPATLFAITIAIFVAVAVTLDSPLCHTPPPTSHLMLIVVSLPSQLPLPPSPWPSSLLVACHSRRTRHRPRHRCDS